MRIEDHYAEKFVIARYLSKNGQFFIQIRENLGVILKLMRLVDQYFIFFRMAKTDSRHWHHVELNSIDTTNVFLIPQ